ncbi:serine hydrolase domain-containing protein [Undibacterium flavidum]|uniref:Beta-lactamase family protein n=1 Tax=Undibacterium flavidum TaxID=2762297 RepID=A0ABR6YF50_9BURK|nr:serine hydrolase domain-containing protein [Undibacterium flavidum]MBC3875167.1 beta-lactamase family protein [Undibacterium flavidum]
MPHAHSQTENEIDRYVREVQRSHKIPGLALAIVRDGKLIHRGNYGWANLEFSVPVTDDTVFPLFSSTKIFSALAVHQLIEQGKLSLDSKLVDFLTDLPEAWREVTIAHLLSHSSGLPDIVTYENLPEAEAQQAVYAKAILFKPGARFDYNQTNYWLLNRIFQKILGLSLSAYILETQFARTQFPVFFEGNHLAVMQNFSSGYNNTSDKLTKRNWHFPHYNYGAAGLNLSMNAFLEWNQKLDAGNLLSTASLLRLRQPFIYAQARNFTHGWDLIELNGIATYGFTGGMATAYRQVPQKKMTLILLANAMFIPNMQRPGLDAVVNQLLTLAEKLP